MRKPAARSSSPARASLLAGCVAGATLLSGCAAFSDAADTGSTPRVVAAFYPLAYVAERVAGDLATVDNITRPGTEPHDMELSVQQTARLADADLVVYEADFQPVVDDAVQENATGDVLEVSEVVDLAPVAEEEHADEEHAEEGHEEEEHAHGDLDPHFWQDPLRMAGLADAVAERLSEVDPPNADDYAANAEALRADLEELDTAYVDGLADCERSTVVVSHDAFGYLEKYGLHMEPIAGLSPDAEPTPADIARLQELIEHEGITTVFSERLASPELSETLAEDVGVDTGVLDPIEGLSDETADEDYLSLMRQNLAALESANGCRTS
jgi:zinc transport system substrate-binding protein